MYLRVTRENLIFLNHEYRNYTMPLIYFALKMLETVILQQIREMLKKHH